MPVEVCGNVPRVKIDVAAIPKVDERILSGTILEAVERFYSDPRNMKEFEEWLRRKDGPEH